MIVYHGSIEKVVSPEIRKANRALDYGNGFYTTTSEEQATLWVRRKLIREKEIKGYVNIYEFDENCYKSLNILHFETPTEKWLDFVMDNRTNKDFDHPYDIVGGPVANDRIYAAFAMYESGLLNKMELISELKTHVLSDQWLFHTERSLHYISFKEAKEVYL